MNFTPPVPSQMSVGDLKRLVKTGEGTYLEFKTDYLIAGED